MNYLFIGLVFVLLVIGQLLNYKLGRVQAEIRKLRKRRG